MALVPWRQKYDPFQELGEMSDRLFWLTMFPSPEKGFGPFRAWPALDIGEDKNTVTVKADIPGLKQEEIEVNVDGDILTIKGERKAEEEQKDKNYHRIERVYGSFQRSIQLGTDIDKDKVKASYKNGVLEITLPKVEKAKPKQIKVDVNA